MPLLRRACLLGLLAVGPFCVSGCLFPVIDFDDHSAPHTLTLRTRPNDYASLRPGLEQETVASGGLHALSPRQHREQAERARLGHRRDATATRGDALPRPSVVSPDVPAPELPTPTDSAACHRALRAEGVHFRVLDPHSAPGVPWPIRLTGPVAGVVFEPGDRDRTHAILDCRLALALHEWATELRRAGVRRVEYYSIYRPYARIAGSGRVSGHAHGMAIDAARFTLQGGAELNVLDDWEGRERGEAPCPLRRDESRGGRLLRGVTCSAADRKLFQVVLTPHYNKAHDNHVHLEIKPEVDWTYVR